MAPKDASAVRSLEPDESLGVYGKMMRYGGIVHEISSLAKAIVSLSGPDWPEWTLIHSTQFDVDYDRLDARLRAEAPDCASHPTSAEAHCDIVFIVARRRDGTYFPDAAAMMRGEIDRNPHVLLRSAILKEAAQRAITGKRRDKQTNVVRGARKSDEPPNLDAALGLAVQMGTVKVLNANFDDVVAVEASEVGENGAAEEPASV